MTTIHSQGQTTPGPISDGADRIIRLYPNPATSYVTFDLQRSGAVRTYTIQVYNFLGKKMYESPAVSQKLTVDLAEFNRGVYIYHLKDQTGKIVESGKFQVSR